MLTAGKRAVPYALQNSAMVWRGKLRSLSSTVNAIYLLAQVPRSAKHTDIGFKRVNNGFKKRIIIRLEEKSKCKLSVCDLASLENVMLLRYGNMNMMVKRNERSTGVKQEGYTSMEDLLHEQRDGTAAVPCAAPKLPQLSAAQHLFPPISPTSIPNLVAWPHTPPQIPLSVGFL
ncbi:hypothetical protein BTVI_49996 [Pitangus sulphuratus]|nr:hypothetical protein BTVI_49996 [Pitangus sulphuratus]